MAEPWHAPLNIIFNRQAPKQCMAGRECSKAISAHSISEAKVLKKIAEEGNVITVVPGNTIEGSTAFGPQGIKKVSTFSGFCSKHDQELFACLDLRDYVLHDKEQEFFFAYRTLARSFWFTLTESYVTKALLYGLNHSSQDKLPQIEKIRASYALRAETQTKHARLWRDIKDAQNVHIARKNYSAMDSIILYFPDAYPIAYSGLILLRHGRSIEDSITDPHVVAINAFPQEGQYYAILTCIEAGHRPYLERMLASYEALGFTDNRALLTHLICGQGEAIAIAPSYWERLGNPFQDSFISKWRAMQQPGDSAPHMDPVFNIFNEEIL